MTVRLIRPNDTVSKIVITVSAETVDLHEERWLFCGCAIKALIYEKGRHWDTSFHFLDIKNHKNTNFAIGGLLAGFHRSPLTLLFIFQDSLVTLWLIILKTVQPTNKWSIINLYSQKMITCQLISLQNLSICSSRCKFCVDKNQSFPHVDVELIRTILLLFMSFHCLSLLCDGYHSSNAPTKVCDLTLPSSCELEHMSRNGWLKIEDIWSSNFFLEYIFDLAIGSTKLTNGILKRNLYPYTNVTFDLYWQW